MEQHPIDAHTALCGVIGNPVRHSMSPAIHNAAFAALDYNAAYLAFEVTDVEGAIRAVRALPMMGLSVTIPHKVAVMRYLDELDPLVRKIGACNTVVNRDGRLHGFNTDAPGALRCLRGAGFEPAGKRALILGAGGVARALAFMLEEIEADISIAARRPEQAHALAGAVKKHSEGRVRHFALESDDFHTVLEEAELIINGTSVGMLPNTDETILRKEQIRPDHFVFDTVFNPARTLLLREAEAAGARILSGVGMLVHQAAIQFELWTEHPAPFGVMDEAIRTRLGAEKGL